MQKITSWFTLNRVKEVYWRAALLGLVISYPTYSYAIPEDYRHELDGGCSIYVHPDYTKEHITKYNLRWTWSGDCVEGYANGLGDLHFNSQWLTRIMRVRMFKGKPFGYARDLNRTTSGNTTLSKTTWSFSYGGRTVTFEGLGLKGSDNLLDHASGASPARSSDHQILVDLVNSSSTVHAIALKSGKGHGVLLFKTPCSVPKDRYPECSWRAGADQSKFPVFYFKNIQAPGEIWCPDPKDAKSCEQLYGQLVEPVVSEIEEFIRVSLPKVREMEIEMLAFTKEASQRSAEAAARAARDKAAANALFETKLDKAPVGELFAMADEYKSKGDKVRARTALRKLMGRFPDHKLAALAATMLSDMQGD